MGEERPAYSGANNLEAMQEAENYNRHLCALVRHYAHQAHNALDFGAGIGTFATCLTSQVEDILCVEPDPQQRKALEQRGLATVGDISLVENDRFSYAFTLNVLEHIEDDARATRELFRSLRPGGRLLVYVPAFQILYTSMDRKVGHHRRYRISGLTELLRAAGFRIERSVYTDFLGFFATLLFKWIDRAQTGDLNPGMVRLYDRWAYPLSRLLSVPFGKFVGKNILVIASKPEVNEFGAAI